MNGRALFWFAAAACMAAAAAMYPVLRGVWWLIGVIAVFSIGIITG